jgi:hypothetical protein
VSGAYVCKISQKIVISQLVSSGTFSCSFGLSVSDLVDGLLIQFNKLFSKLYLFVVSIS